MSDLAQNAQQEFWRPPVNQTTSTLAEACKRCGTEFMVGAAFCHICGMSRHRSSPAQPISWSQYLGLARSLDFTNIKRWFGLPLAPLCALLLGGAFLIVALSMGFVDSDFQAIQLWRIQWLMAACAAFLAGILLNSRKSES